jgi:hypothetical protein
MTGVYLLHGRCLALGVYAMLLYLNKGISIDPVYTKLE